MKVMTIVGTRPEIIKLSRVISALDETVDHVLVHTQQNYDYELNQIFFEDLGLRKPDYALETGGGALAELIANVIRDTDKVMEQENPDALLLLGDTNSCLSVIPAKRRRIPIFHMEAGNRCFDQRVPEETNRRIIDHISDINLTYTEHARRYLLKEGLPPDRIIKTGSPMKEVLEFHRHRFDRSDILSRLNLTRKRFILVSAHREDNVDSSANFADLLDTLGELSRQFDMPVIVSTHPRTRKKLEAPGVALPSSRVQFLKPLGFIDYVSLQMAAFCVVSDSGTITEEASILGFPAVTIRQAHERPEGMDAGTLIMCGLKSQNVVSAINTTVNMHERFGPSGIVSDYDVGDVSRKTVQIILSYTDFVNRTVWFK